MFKFKCECEFCGYEMLLTNEQVEYYSCTACNDTGDDRTNEEKYGCKRCEHYKGNNQCGLEWAWLIDDIKCPKENQ